MKRLHPSRIDLHRESALPFKGRVGVGMGLRTSGSPIPLLTSPLKGEENAARSRQEGFTLLEVMIALAVIAIALVILLGLGNRSIGVHDRLQRITQATLLAQQRITEIELQAAQPGFEFRVEEGDFAEPFAGYRWAVVYEETPLPFLRIVRVTVSWGEVRRNEAVDLASFVYRKET